jgi:hypothetical protein
MENQEFRQALYGKEICEKLSLLEAILSEVELEYIEYFKRKPSFLNLKEKHDKLSNHYLIFNDNREIRFSFREDSDLEKKIINECNLRISVAFKK